MKKKIWYSMSKSDVCLVAIWRHDKAYKRGSPEFIEHIADALYCDGASRKNARLIVNALNAMERRRSQ